MRGTDWPQAWFCRGRADRRRIERSIVSGSRASRPCRWPVSRVTIAPLLGQTRRTGSTGRSRICRSGRRHVRRLRRRKLLGWRSFCFRRWPNRFESIQMKYDLRSQGSERTFKIWEYQVSHGQLLIRSPKAPATSTSPEFNGLGLSAPASAEIEQLKRLLDRNIESEHIRILVSCRQRFPVVASSASLSENDWDIFESPFKFRSQYRSES